VERQELIERFLEAQRLGCSVIIERQEATPIKLLRVVRVFKMENVPDVIADEQGLVRLDCWYKHDESEFGVDTESQIILTPSFIAEVRFVDIPNPETR
jgi:hypothetical protein